MHNKIIPIIFGGLGNQLFIYSANRNLSLVTGSDLLLDSLSGFKYDNYQRFYQLDHFNISANKAKTKQLLYPFPRLQRKVLCKINSSRDFINRNYIIQNGIDYDERFLKIKPRGTTFIEGYWQSENYFIQNENIIRNDLQFKTQPNQSNQSLAEKIKSQNSVAVHFRFFDHPNTLSQNNAPLNYYKNAIDYIANKINHPHFFIFSDKPDLANNFMKDFSHPYTLVTHNILEQDAVFDLWLMTHCKHFVIANSTFSWWGGWLSQSKNKIIISPSFKATGTTTAWNFKGLIPSSWIVI